MIKNVFCGLCFAIILSLLMITYYEVFVGNLPSESKEKLEDVSDKYGVKERINNFTFLSLIIEDEEFKDEDRKYKEGMNQ